MSYTKILNNLNDYEGLKNLLDEYVELFDRLERIGLELRSDSPPWTFEYAHRLTEVTGIYTSLNVVAGLLESKMLWVKEKMAEDKRNKIMSELDANTMEYYRRTRNIFQRYTDNAEKIIMTCQSRLKSVEREKSYESSKYK